MTKKLKRRPQRGAAQWSSIIDAWRQSGLTAPEYAARHDVGLGSLYAWNAKLNQRAAAPVGGGFVAVNVVSEPRMQPMDDGRIELVTRTGRVIRLSGRVDADALACVIEVAEQC